MPRTSESLRGPGRVAAIRDAADVARIFFGVVLHPRCEFSFGIGFRLGL